MNDIPRIDVFGWFDSPEQKTPAHDPGEEGLCPICAKPIGPFVPENAIKTISLMVHDPEHRDRSYFYRAHGLCWEAAMPLEISDIESSLIDSIVQ